MSKRYVLGRDLRTAVVTGASAGIGRAVALALGSRGLSVGLIARSQVALDEVKTEIEERGGKALAIAGDIAEPETSERAADAVETAFGPLDLWVNDAMVTVFSPALEMEADDYARVTAVTYLGSVYGTLAALKRMRARDHGSIVQVGSALSYRAIPLQSAYCGAKFAMRGFTDSVRTELIHDNSRVRIASVHLPAVNTPQFDWAKCRLPRRPMPLPPIYEPELAAQAVLLAAASNEREIWLGGSAVTTILGARFAPARTGRIVASRAWDGQMDEDEVSPDRPSNLWRPVQGLHATHGRFSDRARRRSRTLWFWRYRRAVLGGLLAALLVLLAFIAGAVLS
jgi:short-subunit dehydrogenase